ncbi:MAG: Hsp20/alpha crystallin family protein [Spirochaetota bacterium]
MATATVEKSTVNGQAPAPQNRRTVRPVGNICQEHDRVVLRLEMPGVRKDGLDITIDGDTLTIVGRRDSYAEGVTYLVRERRDADFRATYTLDERVNREKVEAKIENGVLTVTLHLRDEVKPRKIEVKAE